MGNNSQCKVKDCQQRCCNSYGTCPKDYQQSDGQQYTTCHTYYNNGGTIGGIIGALSGVLVVVFIVIFTVIRKRRKNKCCAQNEIKKQESEQLGQNTNQNRMKKDDIIKL